MSRRLTADQSDELGPLLEIVESFIDELVFFGRSTQALTDERLTQTVRTYLDRRSLPFLVVTAVLEHEAGLRFTGPRLPFRYNWANWPADQPLAGYSDTTPVKPSTWIMSFLSHWTMVPSPPSGGEFLRVLRSAMWVCHSSDAVTATNYIFDLVDGGHVADVAAAAHAAARLLMADGQVSHPTEVAPFLLGGKLPRDRAGWLFFEPVRPEPEPRRLSQDGRRAVEHLIGCGWRVVAEVRAARNLDEWLSSIVALRSDLRFVEAAVRLTVDAPSTPLRAILSQCEELACDSYVALFTMAAGRGNGMGITGFREHQLRLRDQLENLGGPAAPRFLRERLLLPAAFLQDGIPADWGVPSCRIALPWVLGHTWVDEPALIQPDHPPTAGSPAEELQREPRRTLDRASQLLTEGRDSAAGLLLEDFLRRYPWNDEAHFLLGITRLGAGDHATAAACLTRAVVLRPEQSLYWENLRSVLRRSGQERAAQIVTAIASSLAR